MKTRVIASLMFLAAMFASQASQATIICTTTGKIVSSYVVSTLAYYYVVPVNQILPTTVQYFQVNDANIMSALNAAEAANEQVLVYNNFSGTTCPTNTGYQFLGTTYLVDTYR